MPEYAGWTQAFLRGLGRLAAELKDQTGLDVALQQPGGFHLTLGERRARAARSACQRAAQPAGHGATTAYEMLIGADVKKMLPLIGPEVVGRQLSVRSTAT